MDSAKPIVAVDLGGTRVRVALVDCNGKILDRMHENTRSEEGPRRVVERIVRSAEDLLQKHGFDRALGMGAAIASPQDNEGVLHYPPNLKGWEVVPIKSMLNDRFSAPAWVGNDANLACLGEYVFGAGKGVQDLIYMTISTGVGGGIISGGVLLTGATGLAGEIGHMVIDRDDANSPRARPGSLENLVSGTAIANRAREALRAGQKSAITAIASEDLGKIRAEHVFQAASQGDEYAERLIRSVAHDLALGIVNLVHVFNPRKLIIGGGVSSNWAVLAPLVDATVREQAMPGFLEGFQMVLSQFGDDVGLMGAAALVVQEARKSAP